MLTGRRAFDGHSLEAIRRAVLEGDVPPVNTVNRDVDAALSGIVARAMARDPGQRYRSARQLMRALRSWLEEDGSQQSAKPLGGSSWPWVALASVGLVAAGMFWVLGTGVLAGAQEASPAAIATTVVPSAPAQATVAAEVKPAVAVGAATEAASPAAVLTSAAAPAKRVPAAGADTARARERRAVREVAVAPVAMPAAPAVPGVVNLAVSPWGQIEVDGVATGTTPPLSHLKLPAGTHRIVIRNTDFPPFAATVLVDEDKPVTLRHRFGS
jgi:serine/threonine-protein kinase